MATHLERSLQQGRDLLSAYENKLVIDDTVPEDLRVVDRKKEELLVSVFSSKFSALLTCSMAKPTFQKFRLALESFHTCPPGATALAGTGFKPCIRSTEYFAHCTLASKGGEGSKSLLCSPRRLADGSAYGASL